MTQWMKSPATEYHRKEVIYDVLLPWLTDKLLPDALLNSATMAAIPFRSGQIAKGTAYQAVFEAVRYCLRFPGWCHK